MTSNHDPADEIANFHARARYAREIKPLYQQINPAVQRLLRSLAQAKAFPPYEACDLRCLDSEEESGWLLTTVIEGTHITHVRLDLLADEMEQPYLALQHWALAPQEVTLLEQRLKEDDDLPVTVQRLQDQEAVRVHEKPDDVGKAQKGFDYARLQNQILRRYQQPWQ